MLSSPFSGISLIAVLVFLGTRLVDATKVAVDDSNTARITYSTGWKEFNDLVMPTVENAYNGTFHSMTADGSTDAFFTFTFTGTLVEVKYIAVDIIGTSFVTNTNVNYSIDGVPRGTAVRNPENRTSYVYDRSLLSATGLENVEHTLSVYLSPPSVLLLDYLVYEDERTNTTSVLNAQSALGARDNTNNNNDSNNNTNSNSNTNSNNNTNSNSNNNVNSNTNLNTSSNSTSNQNLGPIIGGSLGGTLGLILLALARNFIKEWIKKCIPQKYRRSANKNPKVDDKTAPASP